MNRQEKEAVVEGLKNSFSESTASFVVRYQSLTVAQMQDLRKELRQTGGRLKVAKARLVKRAVSDMAGVDSLEPYLKEQIGVVFARQEAPAVAKVLRNFAKKNEALGLVAGVMDNTLLGADEIVRIASLPSREVLLAQVCGTLQMLTARLLWTLQEVAEKKQSEQAS